MFSTTDKGKLARERWAREDELIHHRLQWLGVTQGLLFAAYGLSFQIAAEKSQDLERNVSRSQIEIFQSVLCWAGMAIAIAIVVGVFAAIRAMFLIRAKAEKQGVATDDLPGVSWPTTILGWITAVSIPVTFALAWRFIVDPQLAYRWGIMAIPGA